MVQKNTGKKSAAKGKRIAGIIAALALFIAATSFIVIEGKKKDVTLELNGVQEEVRTAAATVGDLLAANDIEVKEYDRVSPALDTPLENDLTVEWEAAKKVTIDVDGESEDVWTTEKTVADVLESKNIAIAAHDKVEPALEDKITEEMPIAVQKAFMITVKDGGQKTKHWTTEMTVREFMTENNIRLENLDKVEGDTQAMLNHSNALVKIARVEKVTDVVEETTDFKVKRRTAANMPKGQEKVVTEGKKGKVQKKFEVTKKNGEVVSRQLVSETVVAEPTHKVVDVGSKVEVAAAPAKAAAPATASVSRGSGSEPSGGREFYVEATAYTAYCAGCSGTTATGINLRANPNMKLIAVDPRVVPLGSKVWVEGYGYAIAGDTGGAIKGNRIDLHMATKSQAYSWGRRQVKMKIIN